MKTLCVECGNVNCVVQRSGDQRIIDAVADDRCSTWIPRLPERLTAMTTEEAATLKRGDRIGLLIGIGGSSPFEWVKVTTIHTPILFRDATNHVNLPHGRGRKA